MLTESHKINSLVWERLKVGLCRPPKGLSFITELKQHDPNLFTFAFGDIGKKLLAFINEVDEFHPDINTVLDGVFSCNSEFAGLSREVLKLAKFAKDNFLDRFTPDILRDATKKATKGVVKRLDAPTNNLLHARFANIKNRTWVRSQKRMVSVDLRGVWKKGGDVWETHPNGFIEYVRHNNVCEEQIELAEKKADRFRKLGCRELCNEMLRDIELFRSRQETYYGFNRITMTDAAIILAKQHQYQFHSPSQILVPKTHFGKFTFPDTYKCLLTGKVMSHTDEKYIYCPRVYPAASGNLMDNFPKMKQIINLLDNFSAARDKPIFDVFWVLVPGIENQDYDYNMIYFNLASPVLLGEKDGKCFFICYWN